MQQSAGRLPPFAGLAALIVDGVEVTAAGTDRAALHAALRSRAALVGLEHRALLHIAGEAAQDLLHRVTSQDIRGMPVGSGAPACLLSGKGKLLAVCEVFRPEPGSFVAEIDRARRSGLRELLDGYIFAERIALEERDWVAAGVYGPEAPGSVPDAPAPGGCRPYRGGLLLTSDEMGVPGVRFHGPAAEVGGFATSLAAAGLPVGGFLDLEALRIDAGMPRFGLDADRGTIPLEANLAAACHPDKGCYVGQEIIARIHTYGHVNRQLCRLVVHSDVCPPAGALLYDDGVEAGRVTSSYLSPVDGEVHALGMLPGVLAASGTELRCGSAAGPVVTVL